MLLKSIVLALIMIVLIGIGLYKGVSTGWRSAARPGPRPRSAGAHTAWQILALGCCRSRPTLGVMAGGVFLMPAVTAFVG